MTPTQDVFLVDDMSALRRKIGGLTGTWQTRWEHFLACADFQDSDTVRYTPSSNSAQMPTYAAFAYLATGEAHWAQLAAKQMRWLGAGYDELLRTTTTADWDTWCYAAPRLRQAIALDWIWDSGALVNTELTALSELFILDSLKFPYVVLHHRIPPHANNQGLFGVIGPCKLHASVDVAPPHVEVQQAESLVVTLNGREHEIKLTDLQTDPPASCPPAVHTGDDPIVLAQSVVRDLLNADDDSDGNAAIMTTQAWDGTPAERMNTCLVALRRADMDAEVHMLRLLDDPDWVVRMVAARTLGEFGSRHAVPALIAMVNAETPGKREDPTYWPKYRLREMAIYALGRIGDPAALPALLNCMSSDEFYGVHRLAAEALGIVGDKTAIPLLEKWSKVIEPETAGACERAILSISERSD